MTTVCSRRYRSRPPTVSSSGNRRSGRESATDLDSFERALVLMKRRMTRWDRDQHIGHQENGNKTNLSPNTDWIVSGFELYFEFSEEVFAFSLLPIKQTVVLRGTTGSLSQFCFKFGHDRVKPGVLLFGKLRFGPHAETIVWMQVKADSRRKIAQTAKDCGFICRRCDIRTLHRRIVQPKRMSHPGPEPPKFCSHILKPLCAAKGDNTNMDMSSKVEWLKMEPSSRLFVPGGTRTRYSSCDMPLCRRNLSSTGRVTVVTHVTKVWAYAYQHGPVALPLLRCW